MNVFVMREISKVLMFIVLWSVPVALAYVFQDKDYLWAFAGSIIFSGLMFGHYADLEEIDKGNQSNEEDDE